MLLHKYLHILYSIDLQYEKLMWHNLPCGSDRFLLTFSHVLQKPNEKKLF